MRFATNVYWLLSICVLLAACGSDDDNSPSGSNSVLHQAAEKLGCESGQYEITGCWLSQQCDEAIFNDQSLGRWAKRVRSFYADGTTKSVEIQYDNANCTGTPKVSVVSPFPDPLTYSEYGSVTTGDGLDGFGIVLSHSVLNSSYAAIYYVTDNDELCFTHNIVLGSLNNTYRDLGSDTSIDFDNCLLSVN